MINESGDSAPFITNFNTSYSTSSSDFVTNQDFGIDRPLIKQSTQFYTLQRTHDWHHDNNGSTTLNRTSETGSSIGNCAQNGNIRC